MKEKKCKFVSFNFKLKKAFLVFLLPFLFIAIRYWHDEIFHLCEPEESLKILKYNLPYLFYLFLPKIFSLIFILIVKSNTKRETNALIIKKYHIVVENVNRKKILLLIYIISLLEALYEDAASLLYYYEIYEPIKGKQKYIKGWLIEKKTCFIIFVPIFSYLILHMEIHKYHYFALVFGCFGSIFINAVRFFLHFSYIKDYLFHLFNMLLSLINSLSLILIKYIMLKFVFLSPYIFLFYDGIFNIINSIILILLQYIIVINLKDQNGKIDNISEENDNYLSNNFLQIIKIFARQNYKFYIYFFLSFIFSFFYYVLYTLVIYNNSPFLIILIEAFLPLDNDIIKLILGSEDDYVTTRKHEILERFFYQSIGYLFLFFGSLILNEIIIFNCWGLNQYTFDKMSERALSDVNDFSIVENNTNDDTDTPNVQEIED